RVGGGGLGQVERVGARVSRVAPAFDQAELFQLVGEEHHPGGVHPHELGDRLLRPAVVLGQADQHPGVALFQAQRLEPFPEHPGQVEPKLHQQERGRALRLRRSNRVEGIHRQRLSLTDIFAFIDHYGVELSKQEIRALAPEVAAMLDAGSTEVRSGTRAAHLEIARRTTLGMGISVVVQYELGMWLNLYVTMPARDQGGGFLTAIGQALANNPVALSIHARLDLLLVLGSISLVVRSVLSRNRALIVLSALFLLALLGAASSGA